MFVRLGYSAEYRRMLAEAKVLRRAHWFWQMPAGYNKALLDQYLAVTAHQVSPICQDCGHTRGDALLEKMG